ncbi:MAG: hypothetical protein ACI9TV_001717 [Sulfurimonas sp.]|jgi:hypothetical protein
MMRVYLKCGSFWLKIVLHTVLLTFYHYNNLMKQKLINNINSDIKKLEDIALNNKIDDEIYTELLKQLYTLKEVLIKSDTIDKLNAIYNSLQVPIKMYLNNI